MGKAASYEFLAPEDPFERRNPFLLLRARPESDAGEIAALGDRAQMRAVDAADQELVRDAVRDLNANPLLRGEWELLTPHGPVVPPSLALDTAAVQLGEFLLGGDPLPETRPCLERFAGHLRLHARGNLLDQPPSAPDWDRWWSKTTHFFANDWKYWHHLALLYHVQAHSAEVQLRESKESATADEAPALLDAWWLRAYVCWARAIEYPALFSEIRSHVENASGFSEKTYEALVRDFPRRLVGLAVSGIESAVRSRRRLCAARRRRYCAIMAKGSDYAPFHAAIAELTDRLKGRLQTIVNKLENKPQAQFEELVHGLLLIAPDDPDVVLKAFQAIVEVKKREVSRVEGDPHPSDVKESVNMMMGMHAYRPVLEKQLFDRMGRLRDHAPRSACACLANCYDLATVREPDLNLVREFQRKQELLLDRLEGP